MAGALSSSKKCELARQELICRCLRRRPTVTLISSASSSDVLRFLSENDGMVCRLRFPAWIGGALERERGIFPWMATVPSGQSRSGACASALGKAPSTKGRARDGCAGRRPVVRRGLLAGAGAIHEGTGETGKVGASRSENLGLHFRQVRPCHEQDREASPPLTNSPFVSFSNEICRATSIPSITGEGSHYG